MIELIGESDDVVVGIGIVSRVSGEISAYAIRSKNITKKQISVFLFRSCAISEYKDTKYTPHRQKYTQFYNVLICLHINRINMQNSSINYNKNYTKCHFTARYANGNATPREAWSGLGGW